MKYLKTYKLFELKDSDIEDYLKNNPHDWYQKIEKPIDVKSNFDKVVEVLSTECSEFLDLLKNTKVEGVFRGHKIWDEGNIVDGFWKVKTRDKRIPRDTYHKVSDLIDNGLEEKFGIPLRSKGVFASKDMSIASDYGKFKKEAFLFFPKNGFRYFWNPQIDDLFTHLRDDYDWYDTAYPYEMLGEEALSDIKWIVNGYQEGEIEKVKWQEITFICDEYYLLDLDYYDQFLEYLHSSKF